MNCLDGVIYQALTWRFLNPTIMNEKQIESSQPSGQSQKKVSLQAGTSKPMRPPVAVLGFAASRLLVPYGNPEHPRITMMPP